MIDMDLPPGVAERCESAEATAWADIVQAMSEQPGNALGARIGQAGQLQVPMVATLDFGPFNHSVGLGIGEQATEGQVSEVLGLYRSAGLWRFMISLSPHAQPAQLPGWLAARGLAPGAPSAKAWRDVGSPPEIPTDFGTEVIGPSEAGLWATIQRSAWGMPRGMTPWFTSTVGRTGWKHYLGFDGRTPVTAAALFVSDGVGWLGFGATLPSHRGRGGETAMIARRIHDAASLRCSLLVTETGEDSPEAPNHAYRNMVRAGFRLAYLRPNYENPTA
jgi:hypothetical protein